MSSAAVKASLIRSSLLDAVPGIVHGFTSRVGGVSEGPYASLNLGLHVEDDPEHVNQNRRWLQEALGLHELRYMNQVHGCTIASGDEASPEADGRICVEPGVGAVVLVADCVPLLLARKDGSAVAAVHAGWRGAVGRIASNAVEALSAAEGGPADLVAAIGPSIGPGRFEIGEDVAEQMRAIDPEAVIEEAGSLYGDLWSVVRRDLLEAGVPEAQIDVLGQCTSEGEHFFSYRRDHGMTGRQAGVIAIQG